VSANGEGDSDDYGDGNGDSDGGGKGCGGQREALDEAAKPAEVAQAVVGSVGGSCGCVWLDTTPTGHASRGSGPTEPRWLLCRGRADWGGGRLGPRIRHPASAWWIRSDCN